MTKFAIAFAAVALLAAPTFATPAAADPAMKLAQADVNVRVGGDGVRIRAGERRGYDHYGYRRHHHRDCSKTVVIKNGRKTTIMRCH